MIKNLTQGSPLKLIFMFCLPILIGNLFQQLYNISDILIVGRLIGVHALAAVGATAPIFFVFLLISFGFAGGLTVVTAQRFGANDLKGMRASMTHAFMASGVLSVLMSVILIFFLKPILRLMNVPSEIEHDAYVFMSILSFGLVIMVFYNLFFGFVRALGDSKTPLYFLIFSTILNIALNFVLIYFFKFGVAGSALGTVLSISIAFLLFVFYVYRKFPIIHLQKSDWRFNKKMLKEQLSISIPMSVQFSVLSISMMVIQSACNSFGSDVIAAFTAALRIEQLATQPLLALGITMATFSAQNWGAGKLSRIRQGVRLTAITSLIISVLMSLMVRYVGKNMISIFLNENNDFITNVGKTYLSISTLFYFFLSMIFIFRNTLQGMGKAILPLMASLTELFVRSFAAVYLAKKMGYTGIFYASPIAWVGAMLVVTIGYFITIKKIKAKKSKNFFNQNKAKIQLKAAINTTTQTPGE
ncbi:MAG: MATE family efflux transporter [Alphaproteobacteria bacterium]|nr:MATE family efflux transporter [Alphaproteobacteria bacterium]